MAETLPERALTNNPVLREMLECGGVCLWETDLTTDVTVYQDGFWEQYGYSTASLANTRDMLKVVHPDDARAMSRAFRAHLAGETPFYQAVWRVVSPSGELHWLLSRGKVTARAADGAPLRMLGVYNDITELKRSEASLAESHAELDAVFRSSSDGLAVVAPDLTLIRANAAALRLVRRLGAYELVEGESIQNVPAFYPDRPVMADVARTLAGEAGVPPRAIAARDGIAWWEFSYSAVRGPAGEVLGAAITVRDITEQKRLDEVRMRSLRLESMGLLAGGIAHDFNNLLAAIVGNIELAQLAVSDPDVAAELGDARDAAGRAAELVGKLLAFSGRQDSVTGPVDFADLVLEMARFAGKIPGHHTPIQTSIPLPLPALVADATQLRQLVLNLLVNALDATREHGSSIQVRAFTVFDPNDLPDDLLLEPRPAASYIVLEVSDDGPGMDNETIARIFDPFFTTKPSGHGLGLASVLGAVRSHGGSIAVATEPDAGASFFIVLPVPGGPLTRA